MINSISETSIEEYTKGVSVLWESKIEYNPNNGMFNLDQSTDGGKHNHIVLNTKEAIKFARMILENVNETS